MSTYGDRDLKDSQKFSGAAEKGKRVASTPESVGHLEFSTGGAQAA